MKYIPHKYFIAEIWEVQAILYFFLAIQVQIKWLQILIVAWGIITIIMSTILKGIYKKEWEKNQE